MEEKQFTKNDIRRIVNSMLNLFKEKKIESLNGIEKIVDQTFPVKTENEKINVLLRHSGYGTKTLTINYEVAGRGIPLEIKINKEIGYSTIVVKGNFHIPKYDEFCRDVFDNIMQIKVLYSLSVSQILQELDDLLKFTTS